MTERARSRRRAALFVSLLLHLVLLSPLLIVAPRLRTAPGPNPATMLLGLVPEAGLGMAERQASPGQPATRQAAHAPAPVQQASRPPREASPATSALAASPAPTPSGAKTTSPSAKSGALDGGTQDAVRRALRAALACAPSNAQNLDGAARAACAKRLIDGAAAMGEAKVDSIPPEKRAYYDAVQKAYQDIRHYGTPDTVLTNLPGAEGMADARISIMPGHPPGPGCGMTFGGPRGAKPQGPPPHSLHFKLGPLTCVLTPPQGVLTEESATPSADDVPKN